MGLASERRVRWHIHYRWTCLVDFRHPRTDAKRHRPINIFHITLNCNPAIRILVWFIIADAVASSNRFAKEINAKCFAGIGNRHRLYHHIIPNFDTRQESCNLAVKVIEEYGIDDDYGTRERLLPGYSDCHFRGNRSCVCTVYAEEGGGKRSATSCWWLLSTLRSCSMLHPPRFALSLFVLLLGLCLSWRESWWHFLLSKNINKNE